MASSASKCASGNEKNEILRHLHAEYELKQKEIKDLEEMISSLSNESENGPVTEPITIPEMKTKNYLENEEISRYSRQLILPEIGLEGQKLLSNSSVLIVGAGGLGCPCAIYLAAAGIGRLGLVDYDEVEISNLHRQILHSEKKKGMSKSMSASAACQDINSYTDCQSYHIQLNSKNALQIITGYNVIVDATDNVATRYLLNDACVLSKKPLVSGSALRFEGQLTVYNYKGGPCYRCLYPVPPPPETVTNCSDGGVLGAVPGTIGCLQAIEVMKIILSQGSVASQKLLLFDALECSFRSIKIRPKKDDCVVCGKNPSITELIDYEQFCGAKANDKERVLNILNPDERISVESYYELVQNNKPHLLIDIRNPVELQICQIENAINIPLDKLGSAEGLQNVKQKINTACSECDSKQIFVVCKRGNDSQKAVKLLKDKLSQENFIIKDLKGGLYSWAENIDSKFPVY